MTSERVTGRGPIEDRPVELPEIADADALFDALGQGGAGPGDDELAGLLAAWRADLGADLPGEMEIPDDLDVDVTTDLAVLAALRPAGPEQTVDLSDLDTETETETDADADGKADTDADGHGTDDGDLASVTPLRRRARRMRRLMVGIAAGAVLLAGFAVGANTAGPDSPFWPVAQAVYPEKAEIRLAEHRIALAREALSEGRYAEARTMLDRATESVNRLRDKRTAQRLRDEIDALRRALPAEPAGTLPSDLPSTGSTPTPAPSAPAGGQPGQPGGGQPGGGQPGGGQQPGGGGQPGGGVVPGLPIPTPTLPVPVPTLPVPVPTVPVPTLPLPTLPLPSLPI